uniref:Uncharacterized protein n=1 Tax=Zea mays TaxID=4577 RepID=B6U6E2_MAIZE|nr:hypothetical protein [Zea mays]
MSQVNIEGNGCGGSARPHPLLAVFLPPPPLVVILPLVVC